MNCQQLAQRISSLRPELSDVEVARLCLVILSAGDDHRKLADEVGVAWPCRNPFQGIVARALEVVHAYEEALEILRDPQPPKPAPDRRAP